MRRFFRKINNLIHNWTQAIQNRQVPSWVLSRTIANLALVGLLAFVLLTAWGPTASGSLPVFKIWGRQLQKPEHTVQRLGNTEVAPVEFEGAEIFMLASPTVWDRTQAGSQLPVEIRAKQVEANLNRVIEGSFIHGQQDGILTNFDPKTLQVSIISLNDVPVIVAGDSYHSQPLKLVTVTYIDADYNGQPINTLAEQWRSIIYQRLYAALMARSPEALSLRGNLGESLMILGLTLVASLVLWLLQLPLKRLNRRLRSQQTAIAIEPDLDQIASSEQGLLQLQTHFLSAFQRQMGLQQQRNLIGFFRWLLAWAQVAVWIAGLAAALAMFPWTRQYALQLLATPTLLLLIWFFTSWVNRLGNALIQGMAMIWVKFGTVAADYPQRDKLRIFTLMSIIKPLKTLLVYMVGIVVVLVYLGIPLSLVLSIIGIVGLALMLVCHPFVKDWMMGGLILWEDQYVVGDVIANGKYTGLVEKMSLRLTQLHTLEGRLVSIANGSITQVENLTRGWLHQDSQETVLPKKPLGAPMLLNGNSRTFGSTSSSEPTVHEP